MLSIWHAVCVTLASAWWHLSDHTIFWSKENSIDSAAHCCTCALKRDKFGTLVRRSFLSKRQPPIKKVALVCSFWQPFHGFHRNLSRILSRVLSRSAKIGHAWQVGLSSADSATGTSPEPNTDRISLETLNARIIVVMRLKHTRRTLHMWSEAFSATSALLFAADRAT